MLYHSLFIIRSHMTFNIIATGVDYDALKYSPTRQYRNKQIKKCNGSCYYRCGYFHFKSAHEVWTEGKSFSIIRNHV